MRRLHKKIAIAAVFAASIAVLATPAEEGGGWIGDLCVQEQQQSPPPRTGEECCEAKCGARFGSTGPAYKQCYQACVLRMIG